MLSHFCLHVNDSEKCSNLFDIFFFSPSTNKRDSKIVCMLDLEHCHNDISAGVGRNVAKFLQTLGPLCLCLHSRVPSAQLPGTSLAKESSKDGAKSQRPPATREYTSIKSPAVSAHSSATRPRCLESRTPLATSYI